jgi:hypothetical protein
MSDQGLSRGSGSVARFVEVQAPLFVAMLIVEATC